MRSSPSRDVLRDNDAIFNNPPTTSRSNLPNRPTLWAYHAKNSAWYTLLPKHGTAYHDEFFLKITRAWYNSLAWYTLCAEMRHLHCTAVTGTLESLKHHLLFVCGDGACIHPSGGQIFFSFSFQRVLAARTGSG